MKTKPKQSILNNFFNVFEETSKSDQQFSQPFTTFEITDDLILKAIDEVKGQDNQHLELIKECRNALLPLKLFCEKKIYGRRENTI